MKLIVAFGKSDPAAIAVQKEITWDEYVAILLNWKQAEDKAARGWSCPAQFSPLRRHSDNFVARYALALDYDHVTPADVHTVNLALQSYQHLAYTTWSHRAERPRWRFVLPLSRPASFDEFQAVSRWTAAQSGIELAARESHTPAQMMYLPTYAPGEPLPLAVHHLGDVLDVDYVLSCYTDWTDRASWPRRQDHDRVSESEQAPDPRQKPGVIGAFCRAYSVVDAIEAFDLPYDRVR